MIGCCNSPPNLVVISQYVPVGSLHNVLHQGTGYAALKIIHFGRLTLCIYCRLVVDTSKAIQFAIDIAKGMAFIHSLDRQLPRLYLSSKHVMVTHI